MFKRILLLFCLSALSGCILPYGRSALTITPSSIFSANTTTVFGGVTTNEPDITGFPVRNGTPEVHPTPFVTYRFIVQPGTPKPMPNFAHPEAGCKWLGIGGQVFDISGNPVEGLFVKLTGSLGDKFFDMVALTGGTLSLGPGGYEFKISDHPIESDGTLWLTLYNKQGEVEAEPVSVIMYTSCEQNLVLVNFTQIVSVENGYRLFEPFVGDIISP